MLRAYRKRHKLTQADLADRLNVSDRYIRRWENGETAPSAKYVQRIEKLVGLDSVSGQSEHIHFTSTANQCTIGLLLKDMHGGHDKNILSKRQQSLSGLMEEQKCSGVCHTVRDYLYEHHSMEIVDPDIVQLEFSFLHKTDGVVVVIKADCRFLRDLPEPLLIMTCHSRPSKNAESVIDQVRIIRNQIGD